MLLLLLHQLSSVVGVPVLKWQVASLMDKRVNRVCDVFTDTISKNHHYPTTMVCGRPM